MELAASVGRCELPARPNRLGRHPQLPRSPFADPAIALYSNTMNHPYASDCHLRATPSVRCVLTAHRAVFAAVLLAIGAWLGGCSGATKVTVPDAPVSAQSSREIAVWRGSDGTRASWDELLSHAAQADVVVIGENHGHPVGLPWAATVFEDVLEQAPAAALSMEFFERDDQSRLDDYLKGVTDEAAFLKRTDRNKSNYPADHRRMVEAAKAKGRPVVAANTTWEVIRFMRGKDYDALRTLTPEQQRLFRIPDAPPEGRYRADYDAIMDSMVGVDHRPAPAEGKKSGGRDRNNAASMSSPPTPPPPPTAEQRKATLDALFRTQYLWDWTMAESVASAVDAGSRPNFLVVGRFHSDFGGGTPQAVAKIRPGTKIVLISVVDADSPGLRDEDKSRADFVVYVGPAFAKK